MGLKRGVAPDARDIGIISPYRLQVGRCRVTPQAGPWRRGSCLRWCAHCSVLQRARRAGLHEPAGRPPLRNVPPRNSAVGGSTCVCPPVVAGATCLRCSASGRRWARWRRRSRYDHKVFVENCHEEHVLRVWLPPVTRCDRARGALRAAARHRWAAYSGCACQTLCLPPLGTRVCRWAAWRSSRARSGR